MTIEIPPEFAEFVDSVIAAGSYRSKTEVVGEALRLLREREGRRRELRREIAPALDRLDRKEGKQLDLEEIKARGRKSLETEGRPVCDSRAEHDRRN